MLAHRGGLQCAHRVPAVLGSASRSYILQRPRSSSYVHNQDKVQQFQQLMLCSRSSVLHMGTQCPQLFNLEASDLMVRLIAFKSCLPGCDIISMMKAQPQGFFGAEASDVEERIMLNMQSLEAALTGFTDVSQVVEERPELLFKRPRHLSDALSQLQDLQLSQITPSDVAVLICSFCVSP